MVVFAPIVKSLKSVKNIFFIKKQTLYVLHITQKKYQISTVIIENSSGHTEFFIQTSSGIKWVNKYIYLAMFKKCRFVKSFLLFYC